MCTLFQDKSIVGFFKFPFCGGFSLYLCEMVCMARNFTSTSKPLHGQLYKQKEEGIDRNSCSWLEWAELKKGTEKVDCGRPRPCVNSKCILGQSNDSECRPLLNVWTGRIVCEASSLCTKLAQIHYANCNDRAATIRRWELCTSSGFLMDDNWYEHVSGKGMGSVKIP